MSTSSSGPGSQLAGDQVTPLPSSKAGTEFRPSGDQVTPLPRGTRFRCVASSIFFFEGFSSSNPSKLGGGLVHLVKGNGSGD
jgi:hypothetical protein